MARDLRGFIKLLEERGQLRRIKALVDPDLEIAEIANRMLQAGGPALLFENVKGSAYPVAINLMGTEERVCWAMNMGKPAELEASNSAGLPIFIAQHTRSSVPIRLIATGYAEPLTFSNSSAGPPACSMRLAISAISKSGSTRALIRRNCPRSSSSLMNPRKSLAIR